MPTALQLSALGPEELSKVIPTVSEYKQSPKSPVLFSCCGLGPRGYYSTLVFSCTSPTEPFKRNPSQDSIALGLLQLYLTRSH